MIIFEYAGNANDVMPGNASGGGTGQSGAAAVDTTAGEVLTGGQSIKFTQQTSSGAGNYGSTIYIPRPPSVTKVRLTVVLRDDNADADLESINVIFLDKDGTNSRQYAMRMKSALGVTEEIDYMNSGGTYTDTTFNWPIDGGAGGNQWQQFVMECDLTAQTYTKMAFDSEFSLTSVAAYESADATHPSFYIWLRIFGTTTLNNMYVDSILLEGID